jgi:hypothetical protein
MPPRLKRTNTTAGIAAPGRRIPKQKSTSSLRQQSTAANGRRSTATPPHSAVTTHPDVDLLDSAVTPTDAFPDANVEDAKMGAGQSHHEGRARTASAASDQDLEAHGSCNGSFAHSNGSILTSDVNAVSAPCALRPQKSMLATATTILKACPLWDVIAILILLLQLPPTIVSVVQFLFALLTFVPPVSGTSLSNLPSLNEVLLGASGAPSFQTIILVDTAMFIAFVCVWTPAQNLALDLAQAVIAISLGGAAASKGGTSNSIVCCLSIIGFSHIVRMQFARQLGLNAIWSFLIKSGFRPPGGPPALGDYPDRLHAAHGWVRKILGVHILTQGLVRLVRRWYLYSAAMNELQLKKVDPDNSVFSALNTPRTSVSVGDSGPDTASSASTDGRPPGPSPATREKDRISNSKKKKKQANHVRSQQPFWAALANAKVTFLKELEHQQASLDAVEANAMDIVRIGNADFKNGKPRVWIKEVNATDISFGVCLPSLVRDDDEDDDADAESKANRFKVRLNRTDWSSTKINGESLGVLVGEEQLDEWSAKIFGLTASTNYICEFIRMDDGAVFCTTHITTEPAPSTEQGKFLFLVMSLSSSLTCLAPAPPPAKTQSLRPLSPKTTLRNSIQAAEQQLEAHRNRLKRNKRDHKNTLASLQKEVDSLNSRLSSNGGNDERLRQKARQLEQSSQQAKAKEIEMLTQIEQFGEVPADEMKDASRQRAAWKQEKDRLSEARKTFELAKASADRDISQAKSEVSSLRLKHQKFEQRQVKYKEQHARLVSETNQSQEAQSRRFHERDVVLRSRSDDERRWIEQTAVIEHETQSIWARAAKADAESKQLEDLFNRNMQQQSVPTTPEGPLPGTRNLNHYNGNGFTQLQQGFQFPPPGFIDSNNLPSLYREGRGRSSSMLSGVSGFTDELDDYPITHHTVYPLTNGVIGRDRRKSSNGSGSLSSGSGQSSTQDPMSPPPKNLSPVALSFASPLSPPPTKNGR